jgi:phasin family protein
LPDFENVKALTADNLETLVRINSVLSHGFEKISAEIISQSVASLESATAASAALLGAKTLRDVVELGSSFARTQYEKMMAGTTRLGELTAKVATDSFSPITERASRLIESRTRPVS